MEKQRLRKKDNSWSGLKRTIAYVEISLIVHVTENLQKVLKAVTNLLPPQYTDKVSFQRENLWGHHKNLILLLKTTIKKKEITHAFIDNLYNNLDRNDTDELSKDFSRRLDEKKTFFFRLNKQKAYGGQIKLGNIDPIRIKIRLNFIPNNFQEMIDLTNN